MPTTFVVKKMYASESTHVFTEIPAAPRKICRFRLLCIFFFFPQNVFKIYMKVVSLKMVTNMYWDLRSKSASEYL